MSWIHRSDDGALSFRHESLTHVCAAEHIRNAFEHRDGLALADWQPFSSECMLTHRLTGPLRNLPIVPSRQSWERRIAARDGFGTRREDIRQEQANYPASFAGRKQKSHALISSSKLNFEHHLEPQEALGGEEES
jgi:hypothetical protein